LVYGVEKLWTGFSGDEGTKITLSSSFSQEKIKKIKIKKGFLIL